MTSNLEKEPNIAERTKYIVRRASRQESAILGVVLAIFLIIAMSVATKRGNFSSFPPFFKGLGAGVAGTLLVRITSAIFIPLLTAMPAPPAPEVT